MSEMNGPPGDVGFEAFVHQYDLREQEERHLERKRKHERTMERLQTTGIAIGFLALAAAVIGVAYIIWLGVRGPSADDAAEERLKSECIAQHGTWIKVADGPDDTYGACMFGEQR